MAQELPVGTVTMLFSDIEGSTALLLRLGDRYAEALSAHRALVRDAVAVGGGRELGTEGDSFFVVFESAKDALRTCVAAQRALAAHRWPQGVTLRVRMGLHSGEPARHEEGYVGIAVHRAARIAATAHGGQVVLSDVTRQLVLESPLPPDISLQDLGWHRLKDIEEPEHIFQLVAAGLEDRFPALRSLGAKTSLPVPMTPLVGRDSDLERLRASLLEPGVRLLTLTGTGGVGKSRLALAAASSLRETFQDGVYFFALAAVTDTEAMWKVIAEGLDVGDDQPAADAVPAYLKGRRALLVLDNLEQLPGAAEVVSILLGAGPGLVLVGTSRRPLRLQGEHEQLVAPLDVPGEATVDAVTASGAAQLFVQQAGLVRPGFAITPDNAADIAAVCRRLDGIPLAIELAASRARLLAPKALLSRLGHTLGLAAGDVGRPSRQQTLRSTIAWSCALLTPELDVVFRRAGVFVGGCDLDALAAVAGAEPDSGFDALEPVAELLDVSLITVTEGADGEPRVGMLETIREYAFERLEESGELEVVRRRHGECYADLAEGATEQLEGPARFVFLDRLETEHDNLRAALNWSLERPAAPGGADDRERAATGLRLVRALAPFWYGHGHAAEGQRWLERAVGLVSEAGGAPLGHFARWLGVFLQQQGHNDVALSFLAQSLSVWRDLDDLDQTARLLNSLGITHAQVGDLATARSFLEESLATARTLESDARVPTALSSLGIVETVAGNSARAIELLEEALVLDQSHHDPMGVAIDQAALATANLGAGRTEEAKRLASATVDYVVGSGDTEFLADTLELLAAIAAGDNDGSGAARLVGAAEGVRQRAGMPISVAAAAMLEAFLAPVRGTVAPSRWDAEVAAGRALGHHQALTLVEATARLKADPAEGRPD